MTTTENPSNETFDLVDYANDPERIGEISMWNPDVSSLIHAVEDNCDAIFTWGYDKGERKPLDKLYEKAKKTTTLPKLSATLKFRPIVASALEPREIAEARVPLCSGSAREFP